MSSKLNNDRQREGAELGIFLTLQPATQGMRREAAAAGIYERSLEERRQFRTTLEGHSNPTPEQLNCYPAKKSHILDDSFWSFYSVVYKVIPYVVKFMHLLLVIRSGFLTLA